MTWELSPGFGAFRAHDNDNDSNDSIEWTSSDVDTPEQTDWASTVQPTSNHQQWFSCIPRLKINMHGLVPTTCATFSLCLVARRVCADFIACRQGSFITQAGPGWPWRRRALINASAGRPCCGMNSSRVTPLMVHVSIRGSLERVTFTPKRSFTPAEPCESVGTLGLNGRVCYLEDDDTTPPLRMNGWWMDR